MASTTKKRKKAGPATVKTTVAAPALDPQLLLAEDGTFTAVTIGQSKAHLVDLFHLDGRTYQIPARPSAALVIRFLREARTKHIGPDVATENLLVNLIGREAWDALAESPEVTSDDVAAVLAIVAQIAAGEVKKLTEASGN